MITLNAGDEASFTVPRNLALKLKTVENQLKDLGDAEDNIPLPNVTGPILEKVLEFAKYHLEHPQPGDEDNTSVQAALEEDKDKPKKPKKTADLCEYDLRRISCVDARRKKILFFFAFFPLRSLKLTPRAAGTSSLWAVCRTTRCLR